MSRAPQHILIESVLLGSWLGMQAVHEFGHVCGAWMTRGRVAQVVLHPLTISRTDLAENPQPLIVVWAGPILGVLLPLLLCFIAYCFHWPGAFVLRFFAGFCLLANGLYIGIGSLDGIGDCGQMLRHGSSRWHLWLFGLITAPTGLWLWHGLGKHFGLGAARGQVSKPIAYVSFIACAGLLLLAILVGGK